MSSGSGGCASIADESFAAHWWKPLPSHESQAVNLKEPASAYGELFPHWSLSAPVTSCVCFTSMPTPWKRTPRMPWKTRRETTAGTPETGLWRAA